MTDTNWIVVSYCVWLAAVVGFVWGDPRHHYPPDWFMAIPALPFVAIPVLWLLAKIAHWIERLRGRFQS